MRRVATITFLSATIFCLLLIGCRQPRCVLDQPLPQRDIVFQAVYSFDADDSRVGFVNADGSDLTFVTLHPRIGPKLAPEPAWTSDGQMLILSHRLGRGFFSINAKGALRQYTGGLLRVAPTQQPELAILSMGYDQSRIQIALFELQTGQVLRSLVIEEEYAPTIGTNALHGSKLVYDRGGPVGESTFPILSEIVLLDIESGQERVLVSQQGDSNKISLTAPAISPDGRWIVYTAADGLHLIRPDGSDRQLLLPMDVIRRDAMGATWDDNPPVASWSPDSRCLVYHRCTLPNQQSCAPYLEHYAIFRLNLETRQEELVVEGAVNPYWRLSPSEVAE